MTPDGLPVLGRLPGFENLIVASGHGMLGVTLGPVSGVIVAQLLRDDLEESMVRAFDPGRFSRRRLLRPTRAS
jgi:D-amino-acid dehydrogenase